jgi:hypothetical protein
MAGYVGLSQWRRGVWRPASVAMAGLAVTWAGQGCSAAHHEPRIRADAEIRPVTSGCLEPIRVVSPTTVCEAGDTHLYVVNVLDFARTNLITYETPGFNLDLCNTPAGGTTGCGHMDRRFDIDQNGIWEREELGVDNQLVELAPILDGFLELQHNVDAGHLLLLIEVTHVESLEDDPCVDVALLLGSIPEGGILVHDGDGRLSPGQAFEIDPASYDGAGNPRMAAKGLIENGRVYVGPATIPLELPADGVVVTLPTQDAHLAFNMTSANLGVGVLGGGLNVDDFIASIAGLLPDDFPPATVRSFLEPLMDLNPDANNTNCDSISLAFSFAAVTAEEHQE